MHQTCLTALEFSRTEALGSQLGCALQYVKDLHLLHQTLGILLHDNNSRHHTTRAKIRQFATAWNPATATACHKIKHQNTLGSVDTCLGCWVATDTCCWDSTSPLNRKWAYSNSCHCTCTPTNQCTHLPILQSACLGCTVTTDACLWGST
jgi:hypothetical protein